MSSRSSVVMKVYDSVADLVRISLSFCGCGANSSKACADQRLAQLDKRCAWRGPPRTGFQEQNLSFAEGFGRNIQAVYYLAAEKRT